MSLLTSCPACGTVFKVQPEQLVPSRGDVRCGNCGQIFNALQSLSVAEPPPESPATTDISLAHAGSDTEIINIGIGTAETATEIAPEQSQPASEPEPEPERKIVAPPLPTLQPTPPRTRKDNKDKRKRIPVRLWIPLCLLLALLAAGQTIYFLRSEIAVWLPQVKPGLIQVCALFGCKVELPRNAQLLSIDDSDLQEHAEQRDVFVLSATIVNRARYTQAYPQLELTLTDIHDKPLLRRTLQPQEYLPPGTDLEAGLANGSDVHITLPFTAVGIAATGYRVYVSYP